MAKDPAFLFYPGDWIGGTMHLDFECKGAYMELLMLQFNIGHMTYHMIDQVLGQKAGQIWPLIQDKFKTDGKVFWNERLKEEKEKRQNYTASRSNNKKGKNQYSKKPKKESGHMTYHMEDENENENTIIDKDENEKKIPENKNYPIDELVEELRQMCGGSLDGTIDSNSINCLDCLEKIAADFPEVDTVKSLRILMEGGRADKFHARNLTNFGYLFRNMIKIKEAININVHGKQDPEMEQLKRDTEAKLNGTYTDPAYDPE